MTKKKEDGWGDRHAVRDAALARRANCTQGCKHGLVYEPVSWNRNGEQVFGTLIRSCLGCSSTPSYVYRHRL